MKLLFSYIFFITSLISILIPTKASAFSSDTYAKNSILSSGKWVKISVSQTGLHLITHAELSSWGFSDPSKVHIYGYGGNRIPDYLSQSNYIDDLPVVQSASTSRGIVFYGVGPVKWNKLGTGNYSHSQNPFSTVGYYFISDREIDSKSLERIGSTGDFNLAATSFTERLFHEKDIISLGETGHLLLGEDFKYTRTQSFSFNLPDRVNNTDVWMECSFATKTLSSSSSLSFTANGTAIPSSSTDAIASTTNSSYVHGKMGLTRKTFGLSGEQLNLGITYNSSVTVHLANLNYIDINYIRRIKLNNGLLHFQTDNNIVKLSGATTATRVWDVTDPIAIKELKTTAVDNGIAWVNDYTGERTYAAWNENASFHSTTFVKNIPNQNLHALSTPDMVIFTVSAWKNQAERIADLHRNSPDSLKVHVVVQDYVFNEFASGNPDVNAFRKMLKMMWDRGNESSSPLKYALFLGRGTYDNRQLTPQIQALKLKAMPIWQSDDGVSDNDSFTTDDIFAILEDNSGATLNKDILCIGVGRLPVRSSTEAEDVVDKLYRYTKSSPKKAWKNQVLLVADDQDNGVHMTQTESAFNYFNSSESGKQFFYNKIYTDAFPLKGNNYPDAHDNMMKKLDEGVVWWNYVGHASTIGWTAEGLLTYTDINNMYLKQYPFLYAATCDFMRWDGQSVSGAEVLQYNAFGGIIGCISATRPVYITDNALMSNAVAKHAFTRDENNRFLTVGEIHRRAKNDRVLNCNDKGVLIGNSNKLRYALMGDPAMRLCTPEYTVKLESINGESVTPDAQVTIMARQHATLKGAIYDRQGQKMENFNGVISVTMYDAEKSTTSNGNGAEGSPVTFEEQGGMVYTERDSVINGEFSINAIMPSEVANNFRPAALNMYAYSSNNNDEAMGCNRDFYIYGYDESAQDDNSAPVITSLYLNHESFRNGDNVNESPMVFASFFDDQAINLSSAGIGHMITLTLDDNKTFTDVSQYYTPDIALDAAGSIAYPIDELTEGHHTLRLKVWDTSGNSVESSIEFYVEPGLAPIIYDIYSDANPAHTEANFYLTHNRPDAMITVTLNVYNLMGHLIWSTTEDGRSDMFKSFPITWNLCDTAGRRVNRGIYIYQAFITTDGEQFSTATKKLAVAAE